MFRRKPRKPTRYQRIVARVAACIERGHVLVADDVVHRETSSVGPYHEAVDRGRRYACFAWKANAPDEYTIRAIDAADHFVSRVGTTRANDAARAMAKRHAFILA